ncbi:MAG: type II toxin-antitoxin system RelB/DinJ family antitoxin [Proteobacteria bacterium]|nr:type II toxin-antitoxin system RelB/DinJ family antitoxin [Pseudomonadota bacterium]
MPKTNQTPPVFAASISSHASFVPCISSTQFAHSRNPPVASGSSCFCRRWAASLIQKAPKEVPGLSRQATRSGTSTPQRPRSKVTTVDMVCLISEIDLMAIASTTLQVRLPVKLRDEASVTLEEMGLDLPTAIRLYLTKVVKTRRIPFELEADPVVESVEAIEVDEALQGRMDRIGTAWKKAAKKR